VQLPLLLLRLLLHPLPLLPWLRRLRRPLPPPQ